MSDNGVNRKKDEECSGYIYKKRIELLKKMNMLQFIWLGIKYRYKIGAKDKKIFYMFISVEGMRRIIKQQAKPARIRCATSRCGLSPNNRTKINTATSKLVRCYFYPIAWLVA